MPKQTSRNVNGSSQHPVHYHKAGNLLLQSQAVLFRVHRAKLSRCSGVLKDMISSIPAAAAGKRSSVDKMSKIELSDDPNELALLLDFAYQYNIDYQNIEKCLRLAQLAHKYQAPLLVSTCIDQIKAQLPTGVTPKDLKAAGKYRHNRSLVPLVLSVATLVHVPEVIPWALYTLSIEPPDPKRPWFAQLASKDQLFINSFSGKLQAMNKLKQSFASKWNDRVSDFVLGECLEGDEHCLRQVSDEDREDYLGDLAMGTRETIDPLLTVVISISPGTRVGELCRSCRVELFKYTRGILGEFFNEMRNLSQEA